MNDHDLIEQLRASGRSSIDPDRSRLLRQHLLSEYDRVTTSAVPRSKEVSGHTHPLITRPMFAAAIVSIILALGLGTTAAANAAKPGDLLFGWDRAAERLRLSLTLSEEAKAKYEAQVAEERLQEQFELEAKNSRHVGEASANAGAALDQAIETVGEVRLKIESRPGKGAEALLKVETRLRELRNRHEANDDADDDRDDDAGANRNTNDDDNDDAGANRNTNDDDDADDRDDDRNDNVNRGTNTNRPSNSNTNSSDDDNVIRTEVRVRVNLEGGVTEIRTLKAGQEQEWELATTNQAEILASITAKTGLSNTQILAIWDYKQE